MGAKEYFQLLCLALMKVAFVYILITVLILLAASFWKKWQRVILWSAGITIFVLLLFSVVIGWCNVQNSVHVFTLFTGIVVAGIYVIYAERMHKKLLTIKADAVLSAKDECIDKQPDAQQKDEEQTAHSQEVSISAVESAGEEVILTSRLDTPLARDIFQKAEQAGLIAKEGTHYKWSSNKNRVLLAYMCGRIYCNDKCEYDKVEKKYIWHSGKGVFPGSDLGHLFDEQNLSQYRQNRKGATAPEDFQIIDKLFN